MAETSIKSMSDVTLRVYKEQGAVTIVHPEGSQVILIPFYKVSAFVNTFSLARPSYLPTTNPATSVTGLRKSKATLKFAFAGEVKVKTSDLITAFKKALNS